MGQRKEAFKSPVREISFQKTLSTKSFNSSLAHSLLRGSSHQRDSFGRVAEHDKMCDWLENSRSGVAE